MYKEYYTDIWKTPTLMLNFFLIRVRKNPRYSATEMVKAAARYRKQCRFVTMKAIKLRKAPIARRK